MASDHVPVLLMSATCRPIAVDAIRKSLKLTEELLVILRGELVRPEIRLIRLTMEHSMRSCDDLLRFYPSKHKIPDASLPRLP